MNIEEKFAENPEKSENAVFSEKVVAGYWEKISRAYTFAFRILVPALLLFTVLFVVLCSGAFTYDSFFYFGKDLQALASLADTDDGVIYYTYDETCSTHLAYHGGVAVVHGKGIEVYDAGGNRLLTVDHAFRVPRASTSRNYLLTYDFGGTSFSVCNSYAELYHGTTAFPIYGATISDAGYFTLITASDQSLSQVLLYDGNFNLIQRFHRGSATVGAAVSENGRYVALLGTVVKGGVLDVFIIGDETPISSRRFENENPLSVGFTASSILAVVTDRVVHTMHAEGKIYDAFSFDGAMPVDFSVSEEGCAVAFVTDAMHATFGVVVLNKKGKVECEKMLNGHLRDLSLADNMLWLLAEDGVEAVDIDSGETVLRAAVNSSANSIYAFDGDSAYVFYPAQAVKFSTDYEEE